MPHNSATQQRKRSQDEEGRGPREWVCHAGIMMGSHQQYWWGLTCCAMPLLPGKKSYGKALWQLPGPGPCGITTLSGLSHTCCHFCRLVLLKHMSCPILYPWICTVQSLLVCIACGKLSYQSLDLQTVTPFAHSIKVEPKSCSSCSSL